MGGPVQQHHRENYERTDDVIGSVRVLLTALEAADDAAPPRERMDQFAQAVPGLIRLIADKLEELDVARSQEWAGLGGRTERLTAEQLAASLPKGVA